MIIGSGAAQITAVELSGREPRSPHEQGSRDSADVTRMFWQPGRVDEDAKMRGRAAFLGWAELKEETSTVEDEEDDNFGKVRRWIERTLPHSYITAGGPWDTGFDPYIYASWADCEPASGHTVAALFPEVGPTAQNGFLWTVRYSNWPWQWLEDGAILAPNGVLAAGGGANAGFEDLPARPHEGIALEGSWLAAPGKTGTRCIARFARTAGKTVSLPNGFMEFIPVPADPLSPLADRQSIPYGIPFHHFKMDVEYHWWTPAAAINHELFAKYMNMTCNDDAFDFAPAGTLTLKNYEHDPGIQGYVGSTRMSMVKAKFSYEPNFDEPTGLFRGVNSSYRSQDGRLRFWPYRARTTAAVSASNVFRAVDYADLFAPPSTAI